jgi:hypothetical protein
VKVPQGLKAAFLLTGSGRLEAVPSRTIYDGSCGPAILVSSQRQSSPGAELRSGIFQHRFSSR